MRRCRHCGHSADAHTANGCVVCGCIKCGARPEDEGSPPPHLGGGGGVLRREPLDRPRGAGEGDGTRWRGHEGRAGSEAPGAPPTSTGGAGEDDADARAAAEGRRLVKAAISACATTDQHVESQFLNSVATQPPGAVVGSTQRGSARASARIDAGPGRPFRREVPDEIASPVWTRRGVLIPTAPVDAVPGGRATSSPAAAARAGPHGIATSTADSAETPRPGPTPAGSPARGGTGDVAGAEGRTVRRRTPSGCASRIHLHYYT